MNDTRAIRLDEEALRAIPEKWAQPPPETLGKLPKPTKKGAPKGRCDECGGWHGLPAVHLDYMGHADVTEALLAIDPLWSLDPVCDERGVPIVDSVAGELTMWARLTILGHTRMCVGTCPSDSFESRKQLMSDAIRNGAMRFGIATRLWSKSDGVDQTNHAADADLSLVARAETVFAELQSLNVVRRTLFTQWKGDRSARVGALAGDERWLEQVESWLDEHQNDGQGES